MRKEKYVNQVGVLFDNDFHKLLTEVTDKKEVSKSEYIRNIIERELEKENEDD